MKNFDEWVHDLLDLKRCPRSGWFRIGIERPESVADHSFAVGLLAWQIAEREGLDSGKALLMGLLHDFHEAKLGDIPTPFKKWLGLERVLEAEEAIQNSQWEGLPGKGREVLEELMKGESPEASLVHAIDALEFAFQALRYREAGNQGAELFLEGMRDSAAAKHPLTSGLLEELLDKKKPPKGE
ncbi:MAG: HD family hydrolase [Candidatus Krumholzibacteria bacterium]|jgi:putative hydrolase of HD superfamily|nr:HD family hydrolase [Candidatus Krumholzibacteria bacterium]MDP6668786.1 HD family hydrolase [Candidatus Krumholzibacteria bacterium]MDP6797590.1 HD family hydrolase [Candidatus Krumholzibacteria bacterium]MDP7020913.1 HD family hydrolase [Candidatus Krumholzibacteria bacterium]